MAIHVLISPAIQDGVALWPEMFPVEKIEQFRREMGTMIFNLQYQNDARLARGSIFKPGWLRKHRGAPGGSMNFTGIDLAVSRSLNADYFAAVTVRVVGENFYVIDARRDRCSFLAQIEHVKRIAEDFKPRKIGVEAVAYQAAFASYLADTTDLPVAPVHPRGDKISRAYRLSALAEAGRLFIGEHHAELEGELIEFPDARHDDLLDALEISESSRPSVQSSAPRPRQSPGSLSPASATSSCSPTTMKSCAQRTAIFSLSQISATTRISTWNRSATAEYISRERRRARNRSENR